ITEVVEMPDSIIRSQIDAIITDIGTDAVKTGMLSSAEIIETIVEKLKEHRLRTVVVDPVMVAKAGARLLHEDAVDALKTQILERKLSDRITVTEDDLGISSQDYFINKARWRVSEGGLWIEVLWSIARIEIDNEVFWVLGKSGYSELGQTTILPF
ncbi:MAG: bifunctional hydroxymethylpyrimidine kinase/phosphomethylpyrimidine kinase, partial [Chloroflexi bacterium]|nr:bifunctional hydroxymethylpyrimidine kinase/phosphomethylpyrimidine kinase [Chloroflexota bacterium]